MIALAQRTNLTLNIHVAVQLLFAAMISAYFVVGATAYFDGLTYVLVVGLLILSLVGAYAAYRWNIHILHALLLAFYIFLFPRMVQYVIAPNSVVSPVSELSLSDINIGLLAAFPAIALFILGLVLPYVYNKRVAPRRDFTLPHHAIWVCSILFVIMQVIETYIYSDPQNSIFSLALFEKSEIPMLLKVFLTAVSADMFLFAIVYWFITRDETGDNEIIPVLTVFAAIALYIFGASMAGSRGGGFRIFEYAAAIGIIFMRMRPIAFPRAVMVAFIAAIVSVALVAVAHSERDKLTIAGIKERLAPGMSELLLPDALKETATEAAFRILNRLGYTDYLVVTHARTADKNCVGTYLSWEHYLKNTANFILPGDPYMDARLNSSNAFAICYRGVTESMIPRYSSEIWPITGLAHVMAPGLSWVFVFSLALFLGIFSRWLSERDAPLSNVTYAFWVFSFPFLFFFSMGIDHTVNSIITFGLRLAAVLLAVAATGAVLNRRRNENQGPMPSLEASSVGS